MIVIIFCKIQILRKKLVVFRIEAHTVLCTFFIYQNPAPALKYKKNKCYLHWGFLTTK